MDGKSVAACLLALLWGVGWAWALWETGWGRFIRLKRTWLSVVVGVGVDLLLMGLVVELRVWVWLVGIVGLSPCDLVRVVNQHRPRDHVRHRCVVHIVRSVRQDWRSR